MAQLPAATTAPRVEPSLVCQGDGVCVTTGDLHNFDRLEKIDETWCRLIRVALDIRGQVPHRWQTKLSTGAGSPRVNVAFDVYRHGMTIAAGNLVDALVSQLFYFERVRLEWIPISIFGHLADNTAAVAELAHLAATPRV